MTAKAVNKTTTVRITATSTAKKKVKATAVLTIKKGTANKSITLNKTMHSMKAGDIVTLKVSKWNPQKTSVKKLTWASGNKKVATVSGNGVVKAVAIGNAKITATNTYGKKAACTVTVSAKKAGPDDPPSNSDDPNPSDPSVPAPSAPANLISSATTEAVTLGWDAVSGASGYEIYRATAQNGTYAYIASIGGTAFSDSESAGTGLNKGRAYFYKVLAYKEQAGKKGRSGYSNIENNGVITIDISFGGGSWGYSNGQIVSYTQSVTISTSGGKGSDISVIEYLTSTYAPHVGETDRTTSAGTVSQIDQRFTFNRTLYLYNNGAQSSNLMTYHVSCEGAAASKGYNYCSAKFSVQGNWGTPYVNPDW